MFFWQYKHRAKVLELELSAVQNSVAQLNEEKRLLESRFEAETKALEVAKVQQALSRRLMAGLGQFGNSLKELKGSFSELSQLLGSRRSEALKTRDESGQVRDRMVSLVQRLGDARNSAASSARSAHWGNGIIKGEAINSTRAKWILEPLKSPTGWCTFMPKRLCKLIMTVAQKML